MKAAVGKAKSRGAGKTSTSGEARFTKRSLRGGVDLSLLTTWPSISLTLVAPTPYPRARPVVCKTTVGRLPASRKTVLGGASGSGQVALKTAGDYGW